MLHIPHSFSNLWFFKLDLILVKGQKSLWLTKHTFDPNPKNSKAYYMTTCSEYLLSKSWLHVLHESGIQQQCADSSELRWTSTSYCELFIATPRGNWTTNSLYVFLLVDRFLNLALHLWGPMWWQWSATLREGRGSRPTRLRSSGGWWCTLPSR